MFAWRPRKNNSLAGNASSSLAGKSLVMLVGPSAIGKSALMNQVSRQSSAFGRVSGFTTRRPRSDDEPGLYRYVSKIEAEQKIASKRIVQYAVSPTTGQIYGSEPSDYPAKYNLLDTLSSVVEDLRLMPFDNTLTVSLTAPAEQWRSWFLSRYPGPSDEALRRLEEARMSINWCLSDSRTYWLTNTHGNLAQTATKLIEITTTQPSHYRNPTEPHALLELIERGIWETNA